jgi:hypothetical protein
MIKISGNSSLVLSGSGLVVESLDLDGALVVECEEGATGTIQNLSVKNSGWVKVSDDSNIDEVIQMRGYNMNKINTETIVFKKDGSIVGNYPSSGKNGFANLTKPCAESSGRDIFCAGCAIM